MGRLRLWLWLGYGGGDSGGGTTTPPVTPPPVTTPPVTTPPDAGTPVVPTVDNTGAITNAPPNNTVCVNANQQNQPMPAGAIQTCQLVTGTGSGGPGGAVIEIINGGVRRIPTLNLVIVQPADTTRIALVEESVPTEQAAYAVPMVVESPPIMVTPPPPPKATPVPPAVPEIRNAVRGYW